jgi:nitrite reductase (NO-forming)
MRFVFSNRVPRQRALLVSAAAITGLGFAAGLFFMQPAAGIPAPQKPADIPSAPAMTQIMGAEKAADIVRDPTDIPAPVGARGPRHIDVDLETVEVTGQLADGTTYKYWTFNSKVPGPFIRIRVGDTVQVHLHNDAHSKMMHNVDFHAVLGPGGGAKATESMPGETRGFQFTAAHPGLYVYHCAVMMAAQHISNGMYGMILVEPEGGLPKVDREFYVMQGEIYTEAPFGTQGLQKPSYEKIMDERPEYYVYNGAVGALSTQKPLAAKTGETVRIFFGDAGPNKTSSFHIVGEIFDRVYNLGSLTAKPETDVQTVLVPAGGATMVELTAKVPGNYMLVDHALSREERGLGGMLKVEGAPNVALYKDNDPERSAMVMGH